MLDIRHKILDIRHKILDVACISIGNYSVGQSVGYSGFDCSYFPYIHRHGYYVLHILEQYIRGGSLPGNLYRAG